MLNTYDDLELLDIQFKDDVDDHCIWKRQIMKTMYRDVVEDLPSNTPDPCGNMVQTNVFCDQDHAGDRVIHWLHTGILFFLNMAPITLF